MSDLFSLLSIYASRQEETFLTEALAFLLNLIFERENKIGVEILTQLCGLNAETWFMSKAKISITTQFTVEAGRPDIVIQVDDNKIIFMEVKHDASLGYNQLESYYANLVPCPR